MNDHESARSDKTRQSLFLPFTLPNGTTLPNRILMAPMTRCMATEDLSPTHAMAEYYARRAGAGLIITEGTIISPSGQGYPRTPGIFTESHVAGWRHVTDAVHARGGRIFMQIWHVGRVSHPTYLDGDLPVAPSCVPLQGPLKRNPELQYGPPRALKPDEIAELVAAYGRAAANALAAGMDGVEIHGANGYLIDQFLHHHTNRRTDDYGGSIQNMTRFAFAVIDAVAGEIGTERVGLRLSPGAYHYMESDPRDTKVFEHLLRTLNRRDLAYIHTGIFDDTMQFEDLGGTATAFLRKHYNGTVVGCGSYTPEMAAEAIAAHKFDLIAIGRPFIANPDYVERVRTDQPLHPYDESMLRTLL